MTGVSIFGDKDRMARSLAYQFGLIPYSLSGYAQSFNNQNSTPVTTCPHSGMDLVIFPDWLKSTQMQYNASRYSSGRPSTPPTATIENFDPRIQKLLEYLNIQSPPHTPSRTLLYYG